MVRVAAVQFDPHLGDTAHNLDVIATEIAHAAEAGAKLSVFPECALSGYVYDTLDEAVGASEPIPGPMTRRIAALTTQHGMYAVIGMLERVGECCYNSAVLSGPSGIEAVYRKTHTLCLGVDRFTTPGDLPFRVLNLPFARVGILICYDLRFPEPARILATQGAQIICLPTNWPVTSTIQPDVFTRARAAENRVFLVAADRVGDERHTTFLGRSQIVDPNGVVLVEASERGTELIVCDVRPEDSDVKRVVIRPGEHEMDSDADRRPELYVDHSRGGTFDVHRGVQQATAPVDLPTNHGTFRAVGYTDSRTDGQHIAITSGDLDPEEPTLVRVHSECLTGEALGSRRCDCGEQLDRAMAMIGREGGVILYMRQQEGRGIGLHNKLRAYKLQEEGLDTVEANVRLGFPADMRDFSQVAEILHQLGLRKIRLVTNNPDKVTGIFADNAHGLELVETVPIQVEPNEHSFRYLETKRTKMGHLLEIWERSLT